MWRAPSDGSSVRGGAGHICPSSVPVAPCLLALRTSCCSGVGPCRSRGLVAGMPWRVLPRPLTVLPRSLALAVGFFSPVSYCVAPSSCPCRSDAAFRRADAPFCVYHRHNSCGCGGAARGGPEAAGRRALAGHRRHPPYPVAVVAIGEC